mgnify:CR=1 FL=1
MSVSGLTFSSHRLSKFQPGILLLEKLLRALANAPARHATQVASSPYYELKKKNVPFVVVLTDPTTGGVTASWAMLGDILIAEPKATIGFAGRRVIQDTVRETLPSEFQTAEYIKDHGGIDLVIERKYLNSTIGTLLNVLLKKAEAQDKNKSSNVTIDQSLQSAS